MIYGSMLDKGEDMITVDAWVVLNFFTGFLLVLLLIFQNRTSRLLNGRKFSRILIMTIALLVAETVGKIGEIYPEKLLFLAKAGYLFIFMVDPWDIVLSFSYVDCWIEGGNKHVRNAFKFTFHFFGALNFWLVLIATVFNLKWFYYFDGYEYHRGTFFVVRGVLVMVLILLVFIYYLLFSPYVISQYKRMLWFLPIFSIIGGLFQIFFAELDTTYTGIALGCLILFFYFQSKDVNIDYLTGVLNRRGLDIKMQNAVESGENFSAIMMDLDYFKEINDTYGHSAGDKAIMAVAQVLVDIFGGNSIIGRFGGDEFLVIIESTSEKEIAHKIEIIHDAIKHLRVKNKWPELFDISCGYKVFDQKSGLSAKEFQEQIDKLMYDEKQRHHQI